VRSARSGARCDCAARVNIPVFPIDAIFSRRLDTAAPTTRRTCRRMRCAN